VRTHLEENLGVAASRFALESNKTALPPRVIVDVLSHARRTFEMKSEFEIALGAAALHPQLVTRLDARLLPRTRAVAFVDDQLADLSGFIATEGGAVLAFALQVTPVEPVSIDEMWQLVNRTLLALVGAERTEGARGSSSARPRRRAVERAPVKAPSVAQPSVPARPRHPADTP
jgi:hypothetical protein